MHTGITGTTRTFFWKTIHGLSKMSISTHTQHLHNIQQQNNNHTQTYGEIVHKHATPKKNRSINRATQKIQGYNITLTTTQVQHAIKQSKNNNSQGPDKGNIRHQKHILLNSYSSRSCLNCS